MSLRRERVSRTGKEIQVEIRKCAQDCGLAAAAGDIYCVGCRSAITVSASTWDDARDDMEYDATRDADGW